MIPRPPRSTRTDTRSPYTTLFRSLAALIRDRALHYFGGDRNCPAWEPSGDDFLSSALTEALCMKRVLAPDAFAEWFAAFLPERSEEHTSELQSLMRISYAVFCLKKKNHKRSIISRNY